MATAVTDISTKPILAASEIVASRIRYKNIYFNVAFGEPLIPRATLLFARVTYFISLSLIFSSNTITLLTIVQALCILLHIEKYGLIIRSIDFPFHTT